MGEDSKEDSKKEEKPFLGRSNSFWVGLTAVCTILLLIVAYKTYQATNKPDNPSQPTTTPGTTPVTTPATTPITTPPDTQPVTPAVVPVSYSFSFDDASQYPCSDEGTLHSLAGGFEATFTFYNDSSTSLQIIWITDSVARYTRTTVAPGSNWTVDTDVSDLWMIANPAATCEGVFDVAGPGDVTVTS
jgi:hypothetical protein